VLGEVSKKRVKRRSADTSIMEGAGRGTKANSTKGGNRTDQKKRVGNCKKKKRKSRVVAG